MSTQQDQRASEYVLGTLSAEERAAFEYDMSHDRTLKAAVQAWQIRLALLASAIPPQIPPPHVWGNILRGLEAEKPQGAEIIDLKSRVARWRWASVISGALAASLALWVFAMPPAPAPQEKISFASLSPAGVAPAAILVEVHEAKAEAIVRTISAPTPEGKSLELWYILEGQKPVSMGLIPASGSITMPLRLVTDSAKITLAVTLEPKGGSPTGAPTGAIVYAGLLTR